MSYITSAERIGIQKGLAEGEAKGIEKGKLEGIAEGKAEAVKTIAINGFKNGLAISLIQQLTGLSEKELELLKTNCKH